MAIDLGRKIPVSQSPPRIRSSHFEDHLKKQRSDPLFHYTDQAGAIGIIESSELWATKVQYMNDAKEFQLAIDLLQTHLEPRIAFASSAAVKDRLTPLQQIGFGIAHINIFVACFCGVQDLLSQWRAYGGKAGRYSIGFHPSHLYASAYQTQFRLGACIYDEAEQSLIVKEIVDHYLNDDQLLPADVERAICEVGAFFKDESFREEQEWRLVSPIMEITDATVAFRPGPSMVTPYARFPLNFESPGLISDVCVGPCPHERLSQTSVTMLLMNKRISLTRNYKVPPVTNSKIPFRDW